MTSWSATACGLAPAPGRSSFMLAGVSKRRRRAPLCSRSTAQAAPRPRCARHAGSPGPPAPTAREAEWIRASLAGNWPCAGGRVPRRALVGSSSAWANRAATARVLSSGSSASVGPTSPRRTSSPNTAWDDGRLSGRWSVTLRAPTRRRRTDHNLVSARCQSRSPGPGTRCRAIDPPGYSRAGQARGIQ